MQCVGLSVVKWSLWMVGDVLSWLFYAPSFGKVAFTLPPAGTVLREASAPRSPRHPFHAPMRLRSVAAGPTRNRATGAFTLAGSNRLSADGDHRGTHRRGRPPVLPAPPGSAEPSGRAASRGSDPARPPPLARQARSQGPSVVRRNGRAGALPSELPAPEPDARACRKAFSSSCGNYPVIVIRR
jgi:hypothetical protein